MKEQLAQRELDYALFILEKYQKAYPDAIYLLLYFADIHLLKAEFENIKFSKQPVVYAENLEHGPIFENTYFFGPPIGND